MDRDAGREYVDYVAQIRHYASCYLDVKLKAFSGASAGV